MDRADVMGKARAPRHNAISAEARTDILDLIRGWQARARAVAPPQGTPILRTRGGLPGPAFFPEGYGLQSPTPNAPWPTIMVVGHNFGCRDYRNQIDACGREDDKPTWRNLSRLLSDGGVSIDSCFMTNWFVGLQPGDKQVGDFLARPDPRFEAECSGLLLDQMRALMPEIILLLGLEVVSRAHRILPALRPWASASNWTAVDSSALGPVARAVSIPDTDVSTNVVALLHPSFSPSNQRYRRTAFAVPKPEVEMIRYARGTIEG